ncbi:MAG: hypothetical protein AAB152_04805 [Candidatus Coatesbacteria bacterium]
MAPPGSGARWHLATLVLFAVLAGVALATFRSYGVAADEPTQQAYGTLLGRFYATGGRDVRCNFSWDWRYYGGLFETPVSWLASRSALGVHATRSLAGAVAGLAGIAGCWHAALALGGPRAAFVAALLLALIPGWWGQMFINSKDIPFAAAGAWALSGLVRMARAGGAPPPGLAALTGVAIGAALGVRAGGVIYLACLAALLATHAAIAPGRPGVWPYARTLLLTTCIAWLVMLAAWPYALAHPVTGLFDALRVFDRFPTPFPVLFDGRLEVATRLPRSYLPVLLGLTLPEPLLLLLAAGAGLAVARLRRLGRRRREWRRDPAVLAVATVCLCAAFPLLYAVARRTPMYNGIRHTLFILPALACLAAVALERLLAHLSHRSSAVLAAVLVVAAARQVVLTARLFPYEYASFNAFAGGLRGAAGRFDTEYWGTAITEAAAGLSSRVAAEPRTGTWRVRLCGDWAPASEALGPRFVRATGGARADFYLGMTAAWGECVPPRGGKEVITVSRMGVPLAVVLDLRR